MFAIIDLKDKSIAEASVSLPFRMKLPDGGVTEFREVGQTEPAHAPRFVVMATRETAEKPVYPSIETSVERTVGRDEVVVRRTFAPDQSAFQRAIEAHVDAVAAQRGYSSAVSLASYDASTIDLWRAEAESFIAWRDAVWTYALAELAKAVEGKRSIPAVSAFIAELPAMTWPEA